MQMCIGASGKSCGMKFKHWGKLLVAAWAELLAKNSVVHEPKAANIFYDFEQLTIAGIESRSGQEALQKHTVLNLSKTILEILRKKVTDADELKL